MSLARTPLGGTDREIRATLAELLGALDADAEYELRHEDFVADMPQSGERSGDTQPFEAPQWRAHLVEPYREESR